MCVYMSVWVCLVHKCLCVHVHTGTRTFVCMCVCVRICTHTNTDVQRPEEVLDALEPELQVAVAHWTWVQGTELWSSEDRVLLTGQPSL